MNTEQRENAQRSMFGTVEIEPIQEKKIKLHDLDLKEWLKQTPLPTK